MNVQKLSVIGTTFGWVRVRVRFHFDQNWARDEVEWPYAFDVHWSLSDSLKKLGKVRTHWFQEGETGCCEALWHACFKGCGAHVQCCLNVPPKSEGGDVHTRNHNHHPWSGKGLHVSQWKNRFNMPCCTKLTLDIRGDGWLRQYVRDVTPVQTFFVGAHKVDIRHVKMLWSFREMSKLSIRRLDPLKYKCIKSKSQDTFERVFFVSCCFRVR